MDNIVTRPEGVTNWEGKELTIQYEEDMAATLVLNGTFAPQYPAMIFHGRSYISAKALEEGFGIKTTIDKKKMCITLQKEKQKASLSFKQKGLSAKEAGQVALLRGGKSYLPGGWVAEKWD